MDSIDDSKWEQWRRDFSEPEETYRHINQPVSFQCGFDRLGSYWDNGIAKFSLDYGWWHHWFMPWLTVQVWRWSFSIGWLGDVTKKPNET